MICSSCACVNASGDMARCCNQAAASSAFPLSLLTASSPFASGSGFTLLVVVAIASSTDLEHFAVTAQGRSPDPMLPLSRSLRLTRRRLSLPPPHRLVARLGPSQLFRAQRAPRRPNSTLGFLTQREETFPLALLRQSVAAEWILVRAKKNTFYIRSLRRDVDEPGNRITEVIM